MFKHVTATLKDKSGSALVEFSMLMFVLFMVTFSIVEGGYIYYQFNSAQKATQIGARIAATRAPVVEGLADCGTAITEDNFVPAGTNCSDFPAAGFATITCSSTNTPTECNNDARLAILAEIQKVYPNVQDENLDVTFAYSGLGFVGRGKPIPAITVTLKDLTYSYVAVGALLQTENFDLGTALNFNTTQTTIIAEDIGEGA